MGGPAVSALLWRCTDGTGHACLRPATVRIFAPDGWNGGTMCVAHADEMIEEYARLLGEAWYARPLAAEAGPSPSRP